MTAVRFGFDVGTFLRLYPADNDAQAYAAASQLAGDDFVAYATWKWLNVQGQSGQPVYRYYFEQVPANKPGAMLGNLRVADMGSYHSAELEYVFQTVQREGVPVTPGDVRLAELMSSYWANFAKTGNPNAPGLPDWPAYGANAGWPVMHLRGDASRASPEEDRARYQFIDAHAVRPK